MRCIDRDLHKAAETGDYKKVYELLQQGADANSFHNNGYTALMHAVQAWNCTSEQRIKTAQILISNGADPTYIAPDKYQAIILAHDFEVVSLCVDAGVKIDQDLATKLMYGFNGSAKLKDYLKQLGISKTEWVESERQIYYRICDYTGNNLFKDELEGVIPFLSDVFICLNNFKYYKLFSKLKPNINGEFKLYALSRINDALLLSFQEKQREGCDIEKVSLEQCICQVKNPPPC